ncbi:hypothetical protein [Paenibacillus abyssi]|uniref:Transposase n=1 Tax=Paenibacillus abyssi TaxID=1340531 RepID=A0A917G102_9BACL|nr:hypothetical protein [Paenibacillus abyssi]GGG17376.1 hypothetical protein GCM10010916_37770 [Paenibacillus abyssi]
MKDLWLIKNNQAANAYMDEVSQASQFTSQHKGFTKVPHKIHRCYGLSPYEKLILIVKASQGNREQLFFQLAFRQLALSRRHKEPHNPIFLAHYEKKQTEGKTKGQAFVCIMRKLINIVYKMMKNKTAYVMPAMPKEDVV